MTLTQLEYFCAVCRYHSISRAANELFISQPTVSVAIRELENEFHIKLLNHHKNRISITPEGELFYRRAEHLLGERSNLIDEFTNIDTNRRPLRIAIPPLASTVFFPRMLDSFYEKNKISVQLYEYGSVRARKMLDAESIDLALVNMDFPNLEQYNYHQIMTDSLVYCIARTHRYSKEKQLTMEMLEGERIILYNTDSVLNRQILSKYSSAGIKPKIFMYNSQLYTTLNFVRGGDCGAFLYSSVGVNPRDFIKLPLIPKAISRFGIIWKKGIFISDRVQKFIHFAREYEHKAGDRDFDKKTDR
jgi:DNA-binding transcriptional LysR family regulator